MKTTQRGMSLIEIMVGVVIGLIGCVVIFQMYMVAEGRKRTVSSGSDMEISGRLGLMSLERDLQAAGYGYGVAASGSATVAGPALGCNVIAHDTARPVPDFTYIFAPVVITDGAAGAPDSIAVLRGSSSFLAIAKIIDSGSATSTRVKADTGGRTGVSKGDVILNVHRAVGPPAVHQCAMFAITDDTNPDQLTLDHAGGASRYNKGSGFALGGEGRLYNLGAAPVRNIWSIAGNRLVVSNDLAWSAAPQEVADSVINLQAQYGFDNTLPNADGIVDEWTDAAPADWTRVLAVRFALLTRSPQWERDRLYERDGTPNPPAPRWSASADAPFVMTNVDGTADDDPADTVNNWRHYRYNVFEAVVPLRNTILGRQL